MATNGNHEGLLERIAEFKSDLNNLPVKKVLRKHLTFGACSMVNEENHYSLKECVSDHFSIHPNEVFVVGSAKLGFSIAPEKRYRFFCDQSDIDVAIISPSLFDRVWLEVLEFQKSPSSWGEKRGFAKYFLKGWIRPDMLPPAETFEFSNMWFEHFQDLTNSRKYGEIKISAGLYRDWTFFESYQESCISKCKSAEGEVI